VSLVVGCRLGVGCAAGEEEDLLHAWRSTPPAAKAERWRKFRLLILVDMVFLLIVIWLCVLL
jgi:hypothetical protein